MAAVVFGSGSPRHHHHHHGSSASNRAHRVHHSSSNVSHHHHHHQQQQQQQQQQSSSSSVVISPSSHHYGSATSPSQSSSATSTHHHIVAGGGGGGGGGYSNSGGNSSSSGTGHHNHNSPIIMPPASYLSTGTPMSSTSQHHSQYITHHSVPAPTAPTLAGTGAPSPPSHQHHHHHPHNHHTHHNHQPSVHYTQHHSLMYSAGRHHQQSKRKSAVELLAESKPFYVKSENVLDRHQQLNFRTIGTGSATQQGSSGGGSGGAGGAGGGMVIISGNSNIDRISNGCGNSSGGGGAGAAGSNSINSGGNVCALMSPSRTNTGTGVVVGTHHTHHHHHRPANRRSASSSSDLLQTKLRKLLNTADSGKESQALSGPLLVERHKNETHKYDTFSKFQSVKYNQELSVHASNDQSELSVMFPSAFLSPQSLPPQPSSDEDTYCYKAGGGGRMVGCSGMSTTEPLILTEDYRAISPPAEYAAVESSPDKEQSSRCNYQRSYSHSHDTTSDEHDYSSPSYNINSHKSLPDLHSQISRHSPHSEVLSCCSRGNRSNKSGGGSSLNRDSGGSSGHYTHRSEPCCKQQRERERERERESSVKMCLGVGNDYRRDSGSSTQHSGNSYYTYGMSLSRYADCPECKSKYQKDSECLLNFTTPEVPEAFQDDYPTATPPAELRPISRYYEESHYISQRKIYTSTPQHQSVQIQLQQQQTHHHTHKQTTATFQNHLYYQQQQQQQQPQQAHHHSPTTARTPDDSGVIVVIGGGPAALKEPELSPPPTAFKRQKCLRFKHRNRYSTSNDRCSNRSGGDHERDYSDDDRKPILRSKSDISDRYYNRGTTMIEQQPTAAGTAGGNGNGNNKNANGMEKLRRAESMSQLEKFFDRLGLNEEKFDEIYSLPKRRFSSDNDSDDSSTVFFSDVSTVDSTRLPDSTETQPQTSQTYRPTEPPSIVERNARIIKWLCNCRKLQLT